MPLQSSKRMSARRILWGLAILAGIGLGLWWQWGPGPAAAPAPLVRIEPGMGRRTIARQLAGAGVVPSAAGFELWALLHPRSTLQPGAYVFPAGASVPRVF